MTSHEPVVGPQGSVGCWHLQRCGKTSPGPHVDVDLRGLLEKARECPTCGAELVCSCGCGPLSPSQWAQVMADVRRMAIEECESKVRAILEDHIDRRQGLLTAAGPILRALKEAKGD